MSILTAAIAKERALKKREELEAKEISEVELKIVEQIELGKLELFIRGLSQKTIKLLTESPREFNIRQESMMEGTSAYIISWK